MSFQELVKQIREIFRELEIVDFKEMENYNYKNAFRNILYQNYDPPAYIMKIIMVVILKLKFVRSRGKVSWYSYFKFRKNYFKIRDYKFGTWTLEGLVDEKDIGKEILSSETPEIVIEGVNKDSEIYKSTLIIQKKIQKASKLFDKFFMRYVLNTLDNDTVGNYYLNSSFNRLFNIYKFFEQSLIDSFKKFEAFKQGENNRIKIKEINGEEVGIEVMGKKQIIKPMKLYLNIEGFTHYEKAISNYTYALMSVFFSILEFILDSFYLFSSRIEPYLEFKKRNWYEKYKMIFPIDVSKPFKTIYDQLGQIKRKYRNPLTHGLTGNYNLLIPIPDSGLVPISYEYFTKNVAFSFNEISYDDSKQIKKLLDYFLFLLRNEEPYKFYMLYFDFQFPIPINEKEINEIKNKMVSYDDFEQELLDRARYEEMIINRDI